MLPSSGSILRPIAIPRGLLGFVAAWYNIEKEIRESTTKPDFRADTLMQAVD